MHRNVIHISQAPLQLNTQYILTTTTVYDISIYMQPASFGAVFVARWCTTCTCTCVSKCSCCPKPSTIKSSSECMTHSGDHVDPASGDCGIKHRSSCRSRLLLEGEQWTLNVIHGRELVDKVEVGRHQAVDPDAHFFSPTSSFGALHDFLSGDLPIADLCSRRCLHCEKQYIVSVHGTCMNHSMNHSPGPDSSLRRTSPMRPTQTKMQISPPSPARCVQQT